jgi:hypothetical protein
MHVRQTKHIICTDIFNSPLLEAQKLFSTMQMNGCLLGAAYATDIPAVHFDFNIKEQEITISATMDREKKNRLPNAKYNKEH